MPFGQIANLKREDIFGSFKRFQTGQIARFLKVVKNIRINNKEMSNMYSNKSMFE